MLSRDLQAACQRGRWSRSTGLVHRPRRCHHRRAPSHVRLAVRAPDVPQAAFTTVTHGQPRSASRAAELKDSGWSSGARVLPKLAVGVVGHGMDRSLCPSITNVLLIFCRRTMSRVGDPAPPCGGAAGLQASVPLTTAVPCRLTVPV